MLGEIRQYQINKGMVDGYMDVWNKQIFPNHKLYGIKIIGAWLDRSQNQLTWIRVFDNAEDRRVKLLDAYNHSPERTAVVPVASFHMAHSYVRVCDGDFFQPSEAPDPSVLKTKAADAGRAAAEARKAAGAPPARHEPLGWGLNPGKIGEIRQYSLNRGPTPDGRSMTESYRDVWNKQIFPNHKLYGIKIIGAWYDSDRNQLVWIRVFDSEQDRRVKLLDAYNHSPERTVVVPVASYHMASSFIRVGDAEVFRPQDTPDPSVLETAVADEARKYAAARGGARAPH